MEIHLLITVSTENNEIVLNYTKVYKSVMVPSVGNHIKDSLFAVHKKIIDVLFDFSQDKCFVTLEPRVESKERLNGHIQEVATLHNWIQIEVLVS